MDRGATHLTRFLRAPSNLALNPSRMGHPQLPLQPVPVPHYPLCNEFLPDIFSKSLLFLFKSLPPCPVTIYPCKKAFSLLFYKPPVWMGRLQWGSPRAFPSPGWTICTHTPWNSFLGSVALFQPHSERCLGVPPTIAQHWGGQSGTAELTHSWEGSQRLDTVWRSFK